MARDLYNVYTNGRESVLVWCADQMELERMVQEDKIREYGLAKVYTIKKFERDVEQ